MKAFLPALCLLSLFARAAELPVTLPEGLTADVAAAPPLLKHPIMASLGAPGQLFVGDAEGLNLKKDELEKQLPNRVLLLTDTNSDGAYDKVSVFADKMTFPQGSLFLHGSLYVASPPGIWKLTDRDGDGVADERKMIVGGFEYTGNAADVHGPFLHPNGRLYWCHGRKGHDVKQQDGTPVHAGLASGIWSCKPDGADIRWHALASGDNPVEIDFTPEGEILGTMNLFYSNPRGDTIVHWLRGGVYPREDQLKAIAGLPRTLDAMPVVHNFGHTGVSGLTFYRSGALNPGWRGHLFVVHFNTQRVTRMEVDSNGSTYRVAEREFFKLRNSDAHLTDVLEDHDGSILILDTGGWFRNGCPSSLMAKPDIAGAIYRVRKIGAPAKVEHWGAATEPVWAAARRADTDELTTFLRSENSSRAHAAANALAEVAAPSTARSLMPALNHPQPGVRLAAAHAIGEILARGELSREPATSEHAAAHLLPALGGELDAALEHQLMFAAFQIGPNPAIEGAVSLGGAPHLQRRMLAVLEHAHRAQIKPELVLALMRSPDVALARKAADVTSRHPEWLGHPLFESFLQQRSEPALLPALEVALRPNLEQPAARVIVGQLLESEDASRRRSACRLLASAAVAKPDERWSAALQQMLAHATAGDLPLILDGLAKNGGAAGSEALRTFSLNVKKPAALRLKALAASRKPGTPLESGSFDFALKILRDAGAGSARVEAARILAKAKLAPEQLAPIAETFPILGALELRESVKIARQAKQPEDGRLFAEALRDAPALAALQESEVRTALQNFPPDIFEIVAPALRALAAEDEARRRRLDSLPALAQSRGRAHEGRIAFESGKGACIACHRIGEKGMLVGPNLSGIGQIRTERDLLESILFPSATLARDYEAQSIDLAGGRSLVGVIRKDAGDALVIAEPSGQEQSIPRAEIIAIQPLTTSLMPAGLDRVLSEQELLDLVAFLRSCKDATPPPYAASVR